MSYFDNIKAIDLKEFLVDPDIIYAHIDEAQRKETLREHSDLSIKYLNLIIERKRLDNVLASFEDRFVHGLGIEGKQLYRVMFYHTIYFHDLGKINCNFQFSKMKNNKYRDLHNIDCNYSNHSMLSAILYINEFFHKILTIENDEERKQLCVFLFLNAYVISKHHGDLDSFDDFKKKLIEPDGEGRRLYTEQNMLFAFQYKKEILGKNPLGRFESILKLVSQRMNDLSILNTEFIIDVFVYERLLSSLLLASDYYATTEFKNQKEVNELGEINDVEEFYQSLKASKTYQNIRSYEAKEYNKEKKTFIDIKDINVLRNELFLDAERSFLNHRDKKIFYLEAPTGAGKSLVSLNLAFKMVEEDTHINKVFYVYPFNTLIEQNMETFEKIFNGSRHLNNIAVINSLVPIKTSSKIRNLTENSDVVNEDHIDYSKSLLDRQFLHYPIILTTHVSMFRFLFGTNKEDLFPLSQIANSVIIFDEIQSYKNSIWKEIITFLGHYASLLNIKVIIMSATLPNLSKLSGIPINAVNLIPRKEKYFQNYIFKNRVKLDFHLLDATDDIMEQVLQHTASKAQKENINILMEFIYRSSADEAYEKLITMDIKNKEILLLTGESSAYERKQIVQTFKKRKNIILVSTQVIEAGVDLDANIGYKDISLLDSEEQFIGRINRHFSKEGEVGEAYFFNLNSAAALYKMDVRKELKYTLMNQEIRDILVNKEFTVYYDKILSYLATHTDSSGGFDDFLKSDINTLQFKEIENRMNLIDEQYQYSVFLSRDIQISDTEVLKGEKVWDNYVKLLGDNDMDYAERKIKLQEASILLNHFIYKTRKKDFPYEKHIGDLYYITDCEKYFVDGRFVRKLFDGDIFV